VCLFGLYAGLGEKWAQSTAAGFIINVGGVYAARLRNGKFGNAVRYDRDSERTVFPKILLAS